MSSNQVTNYELYQAEAPMTRPIADSTHQLDSISFLVLRIQTRAGITGEGYLLCFQYSPNAILGALKDLLPDIIGLEVDQVGKMNLLFDQKSEYFGTCGINNWVKGIVNIAFWDAWGKTRQEPVHKLLGQSGTSVPIYGSGGWLSYTIDELLEEVTGHVSKGYKTIKIKVGSPDWREDVARLKEVRNAIGDQIGIMIDANQGFEVTEACELALASRDLGIVCFEEPIHHQDYAGFASLKERCQVSLAMGEREFDTVGLESLLARKAIDFWQPDILRIGGVEGWKASATLAGNLPVLPHFYKEYDVPLLCTIPNGIGAESFAWVDPLIDNPIRIKDGYAYPHDSPGWGFNFLDDNLVRIKL